MPHEPSPVASGPSVSCCHSFGVPRGGGWCPCWSLFSFWVFLLLSHKVQLSRHSSTRCSRTTPMLNRALRVWTRLAHTIGNFQARILLTVFYGILVLPVGIIARLFLDPLRIKRPPKRWLNHA